MRQFLFAFIGSAGAVGLSVLSGAVSVKIVTWFAERRTPVWMGASAIIATWLAFGISAAAVFIWGVSQ